MGANDYHVKADGSLGKGLTNTNELAGVVDELDDIEHTAALAEKIAAHLQTLRDKELPMLKGTGFIVIDPSNPRFDGEEITELDDARNHANNVAYKNGVA